MEKHDTDIIDQVVLSRELDERALAPAVRAKE